MMGVKEWRFAPRAARRPSTTWRSTAPSCATSPRTGLLAASAARAEQRVSPMPRSPVEDQYAPLGDYLAQQAAAGQRQVVLPFAQLEVAILGHPLPPPARGRRDWWRNAGKSPHAWYGWLRVGWLVGAVSLAIETVTFTRGDNAAR